MGPAMDHALSPRVGMGSCVLPVPGASALMRPMQHVPRRWFAWAATDRREFRGIRRRRGASVLRAHSRVAGSRQTGLSHRDGGAQAVWGVNRILAAS